MESCWNNRVPPSLWQRPFVDVFQLVGLRSGSWKLARCQGSSARQVLDKEIGRNVLRVGGSMTTSSVAIPGEKKILGLTGMFLYVQLKMPREEGIFFSIHVEVLGQDGAVNRLKLSNMFGSYKRKGKVIQVPLRGLKAGWTTVGLDIQQILRENSDKVHNVEFWCVKSLQVFPQVSVRGVFASESAFYLSNQNDEHLPTEMQLTRKGLSAGIWLPREPKERFQEGVGAVPLHSIVAGTAGLGTGTTPRKTKQNLHPTLTPSPGLQRTPSQQSFRSSSRSKQDYFSLLPDPIMKLETYIGFSSGECDGKPIWSNDSARIIFVNGKNLIIGDTPDVKKNQMVLFGHTERIGDVAKAPGTSTILASCQNGCNPLIRFWDISHGTAIAIIATCPGGDLHSLDFSRDASALCAIGRDEHKQMQICVWDVSGLGKRGDDHSPHLIARHSLEVDSQKLKFSPYDKNELISVGQGSIRFWKLREQNLTSRPVTLSKISRSTVFTDIAFDSSQADRGAPITNAFDKRIYVGTNAGSVIIVDHIRKSVLHACRVHDGPISSMAVSEGFCVTASADCHVRVWPLDFGDFFLEAKHHSPISSVDVSSEGLKVLVATSDGALGVLSVASHHHDIKLKSRNHRINVICFRTWRSNEMATASSDGAVRLWSVPSCEIAFEFLGDDGDEATALAFFGDQMLLCGYSSGTLVVLHADSAEVLHTLEPQGHPILGIVTTDKLVYTLCGKGQLCVYEPNLAFQPSKMVILSEFEAVSPRPSKKLKSVRESPGRIATDPSGSLIAVISPMRFEILLFDAREEIHRVACKALRPSLPEDDDGRFLALAFSPNGEELIATTRDERICKFRIFFSASSGWGCHLVRDVHSVHQGPALCIALSPRSGSFMVTAGHDDVLQVWDAKLRGSVPSSQRFLGHPFEISHVAFSDDGSFLASVGECGNILLWSFHGDDSEVDARASAKTSVSQHEELIEPPSEEPEMFSVPSQENDEDAQLPVHRSKQPGKNKVRDITGLNSSGLLVWHPENGLFCFASGASLVCENLATGNQLIVTKHDSAINSLAASLCGSWMASAASNSDEILLWDASEDFQCACRIEARRVNSLQFSPRSSKSVAYLAWKGKDSVNVEVLPRKRGQSVQIFEIKVKSMLWASPNSLIALGEALQVFKLDVLSGSQTLIGQAPQRSTVMALGPKWLAKGHNAEQVIAFGDEEGFAQVFVAPRWRCVARWAAAGVSVCSIAWMNQSFGVGDVDGQVAVWRVSENYPEQGSKPEAAFFLGKSAIQAIIFQSEGNDTLVATESGSCFLLNVEDDEAILFKEGCGNDIYELVLSFDSKFLVSIGDSGSFRLWQVNQQSTTLAFSYENVLSCSFFSTGECVIGTSDGKIQLIKEMEKVAEVHVEDRAIVSLHAARKWVFYVAQGGKVGGVLFDKGFFVTEYRAVFLMSSPAIEVRGREIDDVVAVLSARGDLAVFKVTSAGTAEELFAICTESFEAVSFSQNDSDLVFCARGSEICAVSLEEKCLKSIIKMDCGKDTVTCLGRDVLGTSLGRVMRIKEDCSLKCVFDGRDGPIEAVAPSLSDSSIFSATRCSIFRLLG